MAPSMVYRLVFAVTVAAIVFIILLQMLQTNQETMAQATGAIKNGSMKALSESMNLLSN